MPQTKIQGKFYPLQHQEWLRACQELKPSERDVLYYLRTVDPYDNGIKINCAEVARQLSTENKTVHRQTVSRALKALDRKGFIDLELIQVDVKVNPKGYWYVEKDEPVAPDPPIATNDDISDFSQQAEFIETPGCVETPPWIATHHRRSSDTMMDRQTPFGSPQYPNQAGFAIPYKTNKDLYKTSPESENVEEKSNINSFSQTPEKDNQQLSSSPQETKLNSSSLSKTEPKRNLPAHVEQNFNKAATNNWIPNGAWKMPSGAIDGGFVDWLARKWLNWYGDRLKDDLYAARGDVVTYFLNNPNRLPIRWEQYQQETEHRYQNAQLRMQHDMTLSDQEQQTLIARSRAITEPVSPEQAQTSYELAPMQKLDTPKPLVDRTLPDAIALALKNNEILEVDYKNKLVKPNLEVKRIQTKFNKVYKQIKSKWCSFDEWLSIFGWFIKGDEASLLLGDPIVTEQKTTLDV
jgi:hypothetical protein